jgi:pyruvyltransferase
MVKKDNIRIKYWDSPNFGDGLNGFLFNFFTNETCEKKNLRSTKLSENSDNERIILGIGSNLEFALPGDFVYGTGYQFKNTKVNDNLKKETILQVRGPITRKLLIKSGIQVKEHYGDAALLMPLMFNPLKIKKKYKFGIIPHFNEDKEIIKKMQSKFNKDTKVIDIYCADAMKNIRSFIIQVLQCEVILSSSLHGIIIGDAYNIPSYCIKVSNYFNKKKCGYDKFNDYCLSVNRKFNLYELTDFMKNSNEFNSKLPKYDARIDVKGMINRFPFIDVKVKTNCLNKLNNGFMDYIQTK